MPFWKGDAPGRPLELGRALGAFVRELGGAGSDAARSRVEEAGLDAWAADNLLSYLSEQREATGHVPDDRTIVVERFRDELGDWRLCVHSPFGAQVNAPWSLALAARLRERFGVDVQAMHADDGIVLRLPDLGSDDEIAVADLIAVDPEDAESLVTTEVGGSALFASRFRECAARALLLPRRHPGKRSPLWHQRQRAAQLLDVARKYPDFPIVLEAVRECLQDVYDVPALTELMNRVAQRRLRVVEVETATPSPFAASLLFGYVGAFMYEGDSPLAERRAAALSLDSVLLAELLGRVELRELLDPQVIASTTQQLQHLSSDRLARDAEGIADLLRVLGPLTEGEIAQRCTTPEVGGWLDGLLAAKRAVRVSFADQTWWAAVEDIGLLRDGVGVAVPVGVPTAFTESVADPLGELLGRYARTHGPFTTHDAAARFGLGLRVTADVLGRLAIDGRLIRGEFTDSTSVVLPAPASAGDQWCDADVLKILRRRSLAALRAQVEPVSTEAYGRFLPSWQQVGSHNSGIDGLAAVIDQLAGVPIPASAVEPLIFGQRVRDYQPAMLDELLASGEVTWSGAGQIGGGDGWIAFHPAESAPLTLAPPTEIEFTDTHRAIMATLGGSGAYFFCQLADNDSERFKQAAKQALWELIWAGWITGDTFAPVRAMLFGTRRSAGRRGAPAHRQRQRPPRLSRYSVAHAQARSSDPTVAGRWSALPAAEPESTVRAHFQAELLLNRYGVLTKGAVGAEEVPGGFAMLYKVLTAFEDAGRCQRGYFVESLGGAQFAVASTVDRLRSYLDGVEPDRREYHAVVLAAADPANPYGAALPWPSKTKADEEVSHRPGRKAGALVAVVDGELAWFLERGGRSLLSFTDDAEAHAAAAAALTDLVSAGRIGSLLVEKVNGVPVLEPVAVGERAAVQDALTGAGFARTPRGLRLR